MIVKNAQTQNMTDLMKKLKFQEVFNELLTHRNFFFIFPLQYKQYLQKRFEIFENDITFIIHVKDFV